MEHIPRVRASNLDTPHITVPYLASKWEYESRFPAKRRYSPWRRYRTWSAMLRADRLVMLTRRRASIHDPFKHRGVLLEVRERRKSAHLVHFWAAVERPHGVLREELPVISVDGVWDYAVGVVCWVKNSLGDK